MADGINDDMTGVQLPQGSVVPGADIWDDDTDLDGVVTDEAESSGLGSEKLIDLETRREVAAARAVEAEWDDDEWLADAHTVAHADDDGTHDGSRGVEVDDEDGRLSPSSRLQRWGTTSMLGASLSGIGVALDKILRVQPDTQIEIRAEDDDDGHLDPVEVKLGEDPEHSIAVLRPWLRNDP